MNLSHRLRRRLLAMGLVVPAGSMLSIGAHALDEPGSDAAPAQDRDFPPVLAGRTLVFPQDHGAHPDWRTEWWYFTAWLESPDGPLGLQLTFFRSRTTHARQNPSRFAARQLLFAHAALADPAEGRLIHAEQAWRADPAVAEYAIDNTGLMLGRSHRRWTLRLVDRAGRYQARIIDPAFEATLQIVADRQPALQGEAGFSRKGPRPEQASYYYSRPHLAVTGTVGRAGRTRAIRGIGWIDHEWSSALLDPAAKGWDWAGINLHDGSALMAFRIRGPGDTDLWRVATRLDRTEIGQPGSTSSGWRTREVPVAIAALRRWQSPRTGAQYPVSLGIRTDGLDLILAPLFDDQELDSRASTGVIYWEGAVRALDRSRPDVELGRGYLELTGYASPVVL